MHFADLRQTASLLLLTGIHHTVAQASRSLTLPLCNCRQRYSNLHAMMDSQREQQSVEETEERERQNSWGYHLRQSSMLAGCVALGAGSMLVLIHVFEGKQGFRPFIRRP
jgi:hypothetical protein